MEHGPSSGARFSPPFPIYLQTWVGKGPQRVLAPRGFARTRDCKSIGWSGRAHKQRSRVALSHQSLRIFARSRAEGIGNPGHFWNPSAAARVQVPSAGFARSLRRDLGGAGSLRGSCARRSAEGFRKRGSRRLPGAAQGSTGHVTVRCYAFTKPRGVDACASLTVSGAFFCSAWVPCKVPATHLLSQKNKIYMQQRSRYTTSLLR